MKVSHLARMFFILSLYMFALTFIFGYLLNIRIVNVIKIELKDFGKYLDIRSGIIYDSGFFTRGEKLKYILQWTSPKHKPFLNMGKGQEVFKYQNCDFTNCFITSNRNYLRDITKFDAIIFSGPDLKYYDDATFLPWNRSSHQKYVFVSKESADYHPLCTNSYDGYFNWTWTYKLDSDIWWGYLVILDPNGTVIGPKEEMQWIKMNNMKPVPQHFKKQLKTKTKLAAVFLPTCTTRSKREMYVKTLNEELNNTGFHVDVFGPCGTKTCSNNDEITCDDIIQKDYFFVLAFESSFSEDFVTEKIVVALQNNAVPIVYGGANYSRFMPDGIYIDAREHSVKGLADKMLDLAHDIGMYSRYFKWRNHYSYQIIGDEVDSNNFCDFCALLNDESRVKEITMYEKFRTWWDPPDRCRINHYSL